MNIRKSSLSTIAFTDMQQADSQHSPLCQKRCPGQWSSIRQTNRQYAEHPREPERQSILQAVKEGRLALRAVSSIDKERRYLSSRETEPRPFFLIQEGVSVNMRSENNGLTIGILNPEPLFPYKENASTNTLMNPDSSPDALGVKRLPDLHSLQAKMREQANREWEIYPRSTSGHLKPDGTFSSPKFKSEHFTGPLPHSELVTTGYEISQIKCFGVASDAIENISSILYEKHTFEKHLGIINPLPLAVYCKKRCFAEVCFDDELDGKQLSQNEACLDNFCLSQNVSRDTFRNMLKLLPLPLRAKTLNTATLVVSSDTTEKTQELLKLVLEPACYNLKRLMELKESGIPLHSTFFHNGHFSSLLYLLLLTEMFRYTLPEEKRNTTQDEEACRLFHELLISGAMLDKDHVSVIFDHADGIPPGIINYLSAIDGLLENIKLKNLYNMPLTGYPGVIVEFDRLCQGLSQQQLQDKLSDVIYSVKNAAHPKLEFIRSQLLALFHYGADFEKKNMDLLKRYLNYFYLESENIIDTFSVDDYIQWIKQLWLEHRQDPFYLNWSNNVKKARQEIAELKKSLGLQDGQHPAIKPTKPNAPTGLQFMVDAFSTPPILPDATNNEKTILKILQHYYRRPGPERVIESLGRNTLPEVWKPLHTCSHVLRARNNGLWYMELLEKFQILHFTEEEKNILALAIIYHDAAAEDVPKEREEEASACYFKRDLTGHYPPELLDNVAQALTGKENDVHGLDDPPLTEPVRRYLHVLRFADRMDFIRCSGVGFGFPGLTVTNYQGFNPFLLDLPPELKNDFTSAPDNKPDFQRHLEAAMHGAADLAQVTGNLASDLRQCPYAETYRHIPNSQQLTVQFERTTEPSGKMDQFIDDNVRRIIAREAGIHACSDPEHKDCKTDNRQGITRGIHNSWYDLRQVRVPPMTRLEKMQYGHDKRLLTQATQEAIDNEVQRLTLQGIPMNLGTLTQKTLGSLPAQRVLAERGLTVVGQKRRRGYDVNGKKQFETVLVVKKRKVESCSTTNA